MPATRCGDLNGPDTERKAPLNHPLERNGMTARPPRLRAAFTLVALLIVIAIIGVLLALLLPADEAAREAARGIQRRNNLKQLALGCAPHEATHLSLPVAGWNYR